MYTAITSSTANSSCRYYVDFFQNYSYEKDTDIILALKCTSFNFQHL